MLTQVCQKLSQQSITNTKKLASIVALAPILVALTATQSAKAGWNANGVNWCGTWNTRWGSETGEYAGQLSLNCSGQVGPVSGTYNNGTMEGYSKYVYDRFGRATAVRYTGIWRRTAGHSGGECQYGKFSLDLKASTFRSGSRPHGEFLGRWSYCDDDPSNVHNSWGWIGTEIR